jgi:hypothetical protein
VASAVELAGALGTMVDHLVLALVREREGAIVARHDTIVAVPPDLAAAHARRQHEQQSGPSCPLL